MAFAADTPWRATEFAQLKLRVTPDGVWGPTTQAAYEASRGQTRVDIDALLKREGLSAYSVARVTTTMRRPGGKTAPAVRPATTKDRTSVASSAKTVTASGRNDFVSYGVANALADEYDVKMKLPVGTLGFILSHEAAKAPGGYLPSARGGAGNKYLGLYQFHLNEKLAWADGTRWAKRYGVSVAPMYPTGWMDPRNNTAAAGGYAAMNASLLQRAGLPVTKETLYACHQQGAGKFIRMVQSGKLDYAGKQSGPSVAVLTTAFNQAKVA